MGSKSSKESGENNANPVGVKENLPMLEEDKSTESEVIQWFWKSNVDPFSDEPPKWQMYAEYQNMLIEDAFQNKEATANIGNYIVKFETMFQYAKADSYKMRKIKREATKVKNMSSFQKRVMDQISDPKEELSALGYTYQHFLDTTRIRCGFQFFEFTLQGAVNEIRQLGEKLGKKADMLKMQHCLNKIEEFYNTKENCTTSDVKDMILKLYTMNTYLYYELNAYLREEKWDSLKSIYSYFYFLMESLNYYIAKPIAKPITVYRGIALTPQQLEFYDTTKKCLFSWNSFTSTSTDPAVADNFAQDMFNQAKKSGDLVNKTFTTFVITIHSRIFDLTGYSQHKDESEILLPAGTILKLTKREKKENKIYIHLETTKQEELIEKKKDFKYIEDTIKTLREQEKSIVAIHSIVDANTLNENESISQKVFEMLKGITCHSLSINGTNERVMKEFTQILPSVRVQSLYIWECKINESIDMLLEIIKHSNISSLTIGYSICDSLNTKIIDFLSTSKIRSLTIYSDEMDDDATLRMLEILPKTQIIYLDLISNLITDITGEHALSKLEHTQIRNIIFRKTKMSSDLINKIDTKCKSLLETRVSAFKMEIKEIDYINSKFINPGSKRKQLKNGDIYIGDLEDGKRHGNGVIFTIAGNRYEGEWKNDKMRGIGIYYHHNGSKYEGQWREDKKHGRGKHYYPDGDKYEGQFENGKQHGIGTYSYADGRKYIGEYKEGWKDGKGVFYSSDGSYYDGQWQNDKKHGNGAYYFDNGDKYEGEFKDDWGHGNGIYYYANGDKYEGEFKDGLKHGNGIYYCSNGDKHEGEFKDGLSHGNGIYYFASGAYFIGQYENGNKHGKGTAYNPNGDKTEGEFINGEAHGKAILYKNNGDKYEQEYDHDELISEKKIS